MAVFENHRQLGPIIKVVPIGIGKGACIAVLTDPNYEVRFFCTMYRLGIHTSLKSNLAKKPSPAQS